MKTGCLGSQYIYILETPPKMDFQHSSYVCSCHKNGNPNMFPTSCLPLQGAEKIGGAFNIGAKAGLS